MKYILIGGSGFIGQHFIKKLDKEIILNLDIDEGINKSDFIYCDINKINSLNKISIPDHKEITLIHLAAVHFDFQKNFYKTNVEGTRNILSFVQKNNINNYVFFSSVATYGNYCKTVNENMPQIPYNNYGKSKLEAEKIIINWHKNNPNVKTIIVRPAVVYGEYNFGNVFNLINQINSSFFAIIGDGKNIKSVAYVENLVESVIFALKNINKNFYVYNYSDYPNLTIENQSIIISKILNKKNPFKIPYFFTKLITIPIGILEFITGKDLKFNSMRIKKFMVSTSFSSERIRSLGFVQKIDFKSSIIKTKKWIDSNDIKNLRKLWYRKASKM